MKEDSNNRIEVREEIDRWPVILDGDLIERTLRKVVEVYYIETRQTTRKMAVFNTIKVKFSKTYNLN